VSLIACALLGRRPAVEPWAAAAALMLGREAGAGVVLWWACRQGGPAAALAAPSPARGAAAAMAARVAALGVESAARGRLVRVLLPEDDVAAGAAAERVAGALGVPCVLAMAGVREEAFERLLDAVPRVALVSDPDAPLAALALDGLVDGGFAPHCLPPAPPGAALLVRSGLLAPAPLRRRLGPLLEGLA